MPGQVKFLVDVDAAAGVRAYLELQAAEKKAANELTTMAKEAVAVEATMVSSARAAVKEYELLGQAVRRASAIPLPRTAGGTYIPSSRSAGFEMSALPSSILHPGGASIAGTRESYELMADVKAQQARMMARLQGTPGDNGVSPFAGVGILGGPLGMAAAGGALVAGGVVSVIDRAKAVGDTALEFAQQIKPLLSLGGNLENAGAIRSKVLATSSAYGIDRGEVAGGSFMLQSAAANFTQDKRDQILATSLKLSELTGGNLQTNLVAVTKLMQTYGNEMGTAEKAASKLLFTEDRAAITMDELSSLLPDVLPAAKLVGVGFDEISAAVQTSTQVMGKNEKTLTGLRNMFLKLGEAQREGLTHAGPFIAQLEELSKVDPMLLQKVFGEREIGVVAALTGHLKEMRDALKDTASIPDNLIGQKIGKQWLDAGSRGTNVLASMRTGNSNALNIPTNQGQLDTATNYEIALAGNRRRMPWLTPELVLKGLTYGDVAFNAFNRGVLGNAGNTTFKAGLRDQINTARQGGNQDLAGYMQLHYGKDLGTEYTDAKGKKITTTDADATDFLRLRSEGFGLNVKEFLQYKTANSLSNAGGAHYLVSHNRKEFDALRGQYNLNESSYVNWKDQESRDAAGAWRSLAGSALNPEAKAAALAQAQSIASGGTSGGGNMGAAAASIQAAGVTMQKSAASISASVQRLIDNDAKNRGGRNPATN